VKALLAVREEFRGIVDLQVVTFAQDGIIKDPGTDRLVHEAMALGADVVGSIPWIEFTDAEAQREDRPPSRRCRAAGEARLITKH
jgi:cytosine/creatinine deaminase